MLVALEKVPIVRLLAVVIIQKTFFLNVLLYPEMSF